MLNGLKRRRYELESESFSMVDRGWGPTNTSEIKELNDQIKELSSRIESLNSTGLLDDMGREYISEDHQIVEVNGLSDEVLYKYNSYQIPTGSLKIGDNPEISFTKMPATIIEFFYTSNKHGNKHKTYNDFNWFIGKGEKSIESNDFRLRIEEINKRVSKETREFVKEIIIKVDNKKKGANTYIWNDKIL